METEELSDQPKGLGLDRAQGLTGSVAQLHPPTRLELRCWTCYLIWQLCLKSHLAVWVIKLPVKSETSLKIKGTLGSGWCGSVD